MAYGMKDGDSIPAKSKKKKGPSMGKLMRGRLEEGGRAESSGNMTHTNKDSDTHMDDLKSKGIYD